MPFSLFGCRRCRRHSSPHNHLPAQKVKRCTASIHSLSQSADGDFGFCGSALLFSFGLPSSRAAATRLVAPNRNAKPTPDNRPDQRVCCWCISHFNRKGNKMKTLGKTPEHKT